MTGAAIVGYAAVPVGIHQRTKPGIDPPLEHEMAAQVVREAATMAGVSRPDIDAVVVAHPGDHTRQGYFHTFLCSSLGIAAKGNVIQVLGNGMTGGHAFDQAVQLIESGRAECVLAVGVHFESGIPTAQHLDYSIRLTGDVDFQSIFGPVPISWYAMDAHRYMFEYDVPRDTTAVVAVKNREHARFNPLAQFRDPLTLDAVLSARPIVEPLGLFEVPARSDGAVALIVSTEARAKLTGQPYARIRGRGFDHEGIHQIADVPTSALDYSALTRAAHRALTTAGTELADISTFQLYAPCTIVEILATEALGLFARGSGAAAAANDATSIGGRYPVNTCGGCLSRGHPPEVSPLYDVVEACSQILGRAERRQVEGARLAMCVSELGKYNAALVHILEAHS
ncbi:acetyl-CoA acyltransferase [Bradyrhizobium sp. AS23.2]|nr:acetyl-CoA acyltransferase [Bradyrhizobium sp. AS23.2]